MENKLSQLCSYINDLAQLSQPIQSNKLSTSEIKAFLEMVDIKRKSYLDLSDVYELVGKVTESELFTIFKFLDTGRTGEIGLQELEAAIGNSNLSSKNTSKDYIFPRFFKIVDSIKNKPKLAENIKKKYNFTPATLRQTYHYISDLAQSKYLNCNELIMVLKMQSAKFGIRWGSLHEIIVKEWLPEQQISEGKFFQAFGGELKAEDQEECLLTGIDVDNASSYNEKSLPSKPSSITQKKYNFQRQSNPSIIYNRTNNFVDNCQESSSYKAKPKSNYPPGYQEIDCCYKNKFDAIEGNINEVLNSIHIRRQKLRQDSLQRQKLIEDVMNRKRQLCVSSNFSKLPQSNASRGQDLFKRVESTYQNHASKSCLKNPSFQRQASFEHSLKNSSYRTPEFATAETNSHETSYNSRAKSTINDLKLTFDRQFNNYIRKESRPFTPLSSQQPKYEINQILKKYNNFTHSINKQQERSLKQLCKSKSGLIYSQPLDSQQKRKKEPIQNYEVSQFKYHCQASFCKANSAKQNVLRRAEEQATRKIEQIERKARMKVLEKKIMAKNTNQQEWGKLAKRGVYF